MKIDVKEKNPQTWLISLQGEVDMSTSPRLREAIVPLFQECANHVIVDLSGVTYMDSSGIATLVEGLQLSRKGCARFTLVGMCPAVEAVFELAYLKDVFETVRELEMVCLGE